MSVTLKSIIFLALTFTLSWTVTIIGWGMGLQNSPLAFVVLTLMMAGPAIAAAACAYAFEKGRRVEALGLRFRPNMWWLWAFAIPLALAIVAVVATAIASPYGFADPARAVATMVAERTPDQVSQLPAPLVLDALLVLQVLVGAAINAVALTFTEELGWRGYLHYLWRPSGYWRTSLGTGAIWGLWHAPAIYLFGLNYPDNRAIGIPIFIVFCTLLAPVMTLIRDRGGSTWAAGIAHGTINAVAGLTVLCLAQPQFPWVGSVGIGGFVALALALMGVIAVRRGLAPQPAAA